MEVPKILEGPKIYGGTYNPGRNRADSDGFRQILNEFWRISTDSDAFHEFRFATDGLLTDFDMDNFKPKSTKDFTIFLSDFSLFWKIAVYFWTAFPYGLKIWGYIGDRCTLLNFKRKKKLGYTFEVVIDFKVLTLTSQINPFLCQTLFINYWTVLRKGWSAWELEKG